jgi:hypothetical protein
LVKNGVTPGGPQFYQIQEDEIKISEPINCKPLSTIYSGEPGEMPSSARE